MRERAPPRAAVLSLGRDDWRARRLGDDAFASTAVCACAIDRATELLPLFAPPRDATAAGARSRHAGLRFARCPALSPRALSPVDRTFATSTPPPQQSTSDLSEPSLPRSRPERPPNPPPLNPPLGCDTPSSLHPSPRNHAAPGSLRGRGHARRRAPLRLDCPPVPPRESFMLVSEARAREKRLGLPSRFFQRFRATPPRTSGPACLLLAFAKVALAHGS
jgi:hypothetical protein